MKSELMKFLESLSNRGLLSKLPDDFDYEWVVWDYLKSKEVKIKKKEFFHKLKDSAMVKVFVECSICGEQAESNGNFSFEDAETELDEFQNELYKSGWRYFKSKEYDQVGITCGVCIKNEKA